MYAAASLPTNAVSRTWGLWLVYFYAPPPGADIAARAPSLLGLDARLVLGVVLTGARLLEALDDPVIGYWTDRTRSRWGRRIPFVLLGTPPWAVLFVLLFAPPVAGDSPANVIFLFVVAVGFFVLSNVSGAPLEALLPQLARNSGDRLAVGSYQVLFGVAGAVIGLSLSSLLVEFVGFAVMAMVVAVIAAGTRYLSLAGAWRYALADRTPSTAGFRRALAQTFSNPQFLAFLPSFVLFQVALQLLTAVLPFYVDTVLVDAEVFGVELAEYQGVFTFGLTAAVIAGMLLSVPIFRSWASRTSKARAYRGAMIGAAAYFPLLFLVGMIPGVPLLVQGLLAVFLAGIPTAGVFLFPSILTADITDWDERRTQTRREGMFYGAQNQVEKLATAVTPLLFALVLLAGDSVEDPTGIRLIGPVAGLMVLIAFISFRRYSIEEEPREAVATPPR